MTGLSLASGTFTVASNADDIAAFTKDPVGAARDYWRSATAASITVDAATLALTFWAPSRLANPVRHRLDDWLGAKIALRDGHLAPGPHAGRSIPGDATRDFTRPQRDELNVIMSETGCHRCGTRVPGTKRGDAIPDHQPALSIGPEPYRLYPHCLTCSKTQGFAIARARKYGQL